MKPKGTLLIVGGDAIYGETFSDSSMTKNQFPQFEILKELLPENKRQRHVEVLSTSTEVPPEMQNAYNEVFEKAGYTSCGYINILNKDGSRKPEYEKRIADSDTILLSGTDQLGIPSLIGGTRIEDIIRDKFFHDENFIITGFNAGAIALTDIMILGSGKEEKLLARDLKTSSGLGLLMNCIIDIQFVKKGRFGRLAHAVTMNPAELGIGLGDDAALVIRNGNEATSCGEGIVVLIDGKNITQTNITDELDGTTVYVENLSVHILGKNCKFLLNERRMVTPPVLVENDKSNSA
jgi:cyanophycinase